MSDDTDPIYTERVHSKEKESDAMDAETNAGGPLFQENKDITSCGLEEALGLSQSMVAPRSTKMFTEGDGAPRMSGDDAIVKKPTKYLCKIAKTVVYELFEHHYDLVQRSHTVSFGGGHRNLTSPACLKLLNSGFFEQSPHRDDRKGGERSFSEKK